MKREDLAKITQQRQRRQVLLLTFVLPLLLGTFYLASTGILEGKKPWWLAVAVFPWLLVVLVAVLLTNALRNTFVVPKCPHCKRWLQAWMLHIAVASGNCGYCGKSIEDDPLPRG